MLTKVGLNRMHVSNPGACPSPVWKERRSQRRYAVELELHCKLSGAGAIMLGKTTDMSSHGVRFIVERPLPIGAMLGLRIKWPKPYPDSLQVELVLEGRVVRSDKSGTAIQAHCYAFGTGKMTTIRELRTRHANTLVA